MLFYNYTKATTVVKSVDRISNPVVKLSRGPIPLRLHYRLPMEEEEDIIPIVPVNHMNDVEAEEALSHRGPRAIAQRIQKQIMIEWFPNHRCAWDN